MVLKYVLHGQGKLLERWLRKIIWQLDARTQIQTEEKLLAIRDLEELQDEGELENKPS